MGSARPRPRRLAAKLLQIRQSLGLSQPQMLNRLGVENEIDYTTISKYERNKLNSCLGAVNYRPLDSFAVANISFGRHLGATGANVTPARHD